MHDSKTGGIDRRTFIGGTGAVVAMGALGLLAGCSSSEGSSGSGSSSSSSAGARDVRETIDTDIAIIGAGASGLAAAVQAAQLGANVVCLESQSISGGNTNGVEGCFGINSSMQKAQGIIIDPGETIKSELAASQCRASGPGYVDMVHNSGENIDWLIDNGVKFGRVDADKGTLQVFHRFESGTGADDYAKPMTAAAEDLGVKFYYNTKADELIKNDKGAVVGVYAEDDDGTIQVNAKSVIVATGGFAENKEMVGKDWVNPYISYGGFPGHDGSGHDMAVNAGARSYADRTAYLVAFSVDGTPGYYDGGVFSFVLGVAAPYAVWVNENGERFINEDAAAENAMMMFMPSMANKVTYCIMDSNMMEIYSKGDQTAYDQIDEGISYGSIFKADTIEDLAKSMGVDQEAFTSTVDEYNGFAQSGSDQNYGKNPEVLIPLQTPPYYALRISGGLNCTIGSIYTDRSFHALDENMEPIEGLYVIGTEGAMLWSNLYTINVSGGCNANNVNSGRVAAKDAVANL